MILISVLFLQGCIPTEKGVVGTYSSTADSGAVVVEIRPDGTYIQSNGGRQISSGKWRLEVADHVFKSLELDNSYRLPAEEKDLHFGRGAMSYQLIHKGGKLCLAVDQDLVYWCKDK
jgi:hypothetical protein